MATIVWQDGTGQLLKARWIWTHPRMSSESPAVKGTNLLWPLTFLAPGFAGRTNRYLPGGFPFMF